MSTSLTWTSPCAAGGMSVATTALPTITSSMPWTISSPSIVGSAASWCSGRMGTFISCPRGIDSAGEMLVGQTLALMYLDPATLQHGGMVQREMLLHRLSGLLGADTLVRTLNPHRKRFDERIAAETVRSKVGEALRRLANLGFIDVIDEAMLRLRPALMRFAEPVRDLGDQQAALERLVKSGEIALGDTSEEDDDDGNGTEEDDEEEAGG